MTYQHNHKLRLRRASEDLQSIETEVGRWREEHPYRTYVHFDEQSGDKRIIAEVFRQPSAQLGLLVGDFVYQLRSALDNLVNDLPKLIGAAPCREGSPETPSFPSS